MSVLSDSVAASRNRANQRKGTDMEHDITIGVDAIMQRPYANWHNTETGTMYQIIGLGEQGVLFGMCLGGNTNWLNFPITNPERFGAWGTVEQMRHWVTEFNKTPWTDSAVISQ